MAPGPRLYDENCGSRRKDPQRAEPEKATRDAPGGRVTGKRQHGPASTEPTTPTADKAQPKLQELLGSAAHGADASDPGRVDEPAPPPPKKKD